MQLGTMQCDIQVNITHEYEKYPVDSTAYVSLKRQLAWDNAVIKAEKLGEIWSTTSKSMQNLYYQAEFLKLCIKHVKKMYPTNNWLKRHGLPMRRKVR